MTEPGNSPATPRYPKHPLVRFTRVLIRPKSMLRATHKQDHQDERGRGGGWCAVDGGRAGGGKGGRGVATWDLCRG